MLARQHENVIRERRTIEATRKQLMGASGKLGTILRAFGSTVRRQGCGLLDATYLPDFAEDVYVEYAPTLSGQEGPVAYRDEIPFDEDGYVQDEGILFDGLSRGMHLDITYWHADAELKVNHRGHLVYHEAGGELLGYVPHANWESLVERLHAAAQKKLGETRRHEEAARAALAESNKKTFWGRMRDRWGV